MTPSDGAFGAGAPALVVVALGSNLGDSEGILREALGCLAGFSDGPLKKSSLWRTEPVDCPLGSPQFLNAVAILEVDPSETPESMLDKLQALEREFGRPARREVNEPRRLDLDLIAFGNRVLESPRLTLPHPRAHLRAFVLAPLVEIAPDYVLPGQPLTAREWLAKAGMAGVRHWQAW
jgi:2-amino-4-hydroxy-6-hydroxymethyldihydropteridine diphosphokinase